MQQAMRVSAKHQHKPPLHLSSLQLWVRFLNLARACSEPESLRGIGNVSVLVEGLSPTCNGLLITDVLKAALELRLRSFGFKVASKDYSSSDPTVYLNVAVIQKPFGCLILLVVMFVSLTVVVLYNMVNDPEWLAKHTLAVELCKYGWSAVGGSIATKFGAFMTDAAEPLKEAISPD